MMSDRVICLFERAPANTGKSRISFCADTAPNAGVAGIWPMCPESLGDIVFSGPDGRYCIVAPEGASN